MFLKKLKKIENLLRNAVYLDIPDLMMGLKNNGEEVLCHYEDCQWLDIGRIDDYSIATKIFEENKKSFCQKRNESAFNRCKWLSRKTSYK